MRAAAIIALAMLAFALTWTSLSIGAWIGLDVIGGFGLSFDEVVGIAFTGTIFCNTKVAIS